MANGEKCNNINCKTIVTEIRKKDGQYKKYCSLSCRRLGVAEKAKQTSLERYGVSNPSKSEEIKQRIKDSFTKKHGEGITNAMGLKEFRDKIVETNIERYGTNKPQSLEQFQEKTKKSNLEKYGTEIPQRLQELKDKSRDTCIEKYGVSAPQQNKKIQQKFIDTCLEKYGVRNVAQDSAIYDRIMKSTYKSKEYILPSGKIVKVQGYETFALNYLLKEYKENEILIETPDKPRLNYIDEDLSNHYYFPDLYIPKDNLIIEVKSLWTYNDNKPKHFRKRQACLDAGYNFKFMIFDKDGKLINDK